MPSILQCSTINNCNCNKTKGVWDTTINSHVVSYIMPTLNDNGQRSTIVAIANIISAASRSRLIICALKKLWACTQRCRVGYLFRGIQNSMFLALSLHMKFIISKENTRPEFVFILSSLLIRYGSLVVHYTICFLMLMDLISHGKAVNKWMVLQFNIIRKVQHRWRDRLQYAV